MLKTAVASFTNTSFIKENLIVDKEGNRFLCVETGSIKCCTFIDKRKSNDAK